MFLTLFLTAFFACIVGFTIPKVSAGDPADLLYQGRSAFQWHKVAVIRRVERDRARSNAGVAVRANRRMARLMAHRSDVVEALRLAAVTWHVDFGLLYRRALCESVLDPNAKNPSSSASGLMQFLTSTWASTPYAGESVWSPYANALAGAWMEAHGRGGEWVCRG